MRLTALLRLYPSAWRRRYEDEMRTVLGDRPSSLRDGVDLARGAVDAWSHPMTPSRATARAALVGGGLWTVAAAYVVAGPAPPDWPFYVLEILPVTIIGACFLLAAVIGCAGRAGDDGGRLVRVGLGLAVAGGLVWIAFLGAALLGLAYGPALAAAQSVAMVGGMVLGVGLVGRGEGLVGGLITLASAAMLIPLPLAWLAFGTSWTAVGIVLALEPLATRPGSLPRAH